MSDHTHTVITPGCYRCELNEDEMRDAESDNKRDELDPWDRSGDQHAVALVISNTYRARHGMEPLTVHATVDEEIAAAILSSPWLASRDRRMKAEALREAAQAIDDATGGSIYVYATSDWLRARAGEIREENN